MSAQPKDSRACAGLIIALEGLNLPAFTLFSLNNGLKAHYYATNRALRALLVLINRLH